MKHEDEKHEDGGNGGGRSPLWKTPKQSWPAFFLMGVGAIGLPAMRRWLCILINAAALLLCVATVALWVRSYWEAQYVGWSSRVQWRGVLSEAGLLRFEHGTYGPGQAGWKYVRRPADRTGLWGELAARDRRGGSLKRVGIGYSRTDYIGDGRDLRYAVYLPHWVFGTCVAVLPAAVVFRRVRRRRAAARATDRLCPSCGYDLRATPDRCPECGAVPTAQAARPGAVEG